MDDQSYNPNDNFQYQYRPGPQARKPKGQKPAGKKIVFIAAAVICVLLLAVTALNSFYTIGEQENAVVTTFGVPQTVTSPGLHFKIPYVQQVRKVDMTIKGIAIGYDLYTNESKDEESLMITSGKSQIQAEIKEKIIARMEQEDLGIQLVNLTIQDAEPPTAEVLAAFKDVENAKQGKETALNNANKYRSEQLPAAEAEADRILQQAEASKASRINEANGQVARFNAMYEEYSKFPGITKQRMYYETMEELLPGIRVILTDENGNQMNLFNFSDAGQKEGDAQ